MSYTLLNPTIQNFLQYNFDIAGRIFLIFFLIFISVLWKYVLSKEQKPTAYLFVIYYRIFINAVSNITLWIIPFLFLQFKPEQTFWNIFTPFMYMYGVIVSIFLITVIIDTLKLGIGMLMVNMGYDTTDKRTKLFMQDMKRNGWFKNGR